MEYIRYITGYKKDVPIETTKDNTDDIDIKRQHTIDSFIFLHRNNSKEYIESIINICLEESTYPIEDVIMDIFLIMFYKRDCRGGEKQKKVFFNMYEILIQKYPLILRNMYDIIPEYGCWRDLWSIASIEDKDSLNLIYKTYSDQLKKDYEKMGEENPTLSLAGKWTPSEKSYFYKKLGRSFNDFLKMLFPLSDNRLQTYRKNNSILRKKLGVIESLMCSKQYVQIDPSKVPATCAMRHNRAFLNIKNDVSPVTDMYTGNRYPTNFDRVAARQKWLKREKISIKKNIVQSNHKVLIEDIDNERYDLVRERVKLGLDAMKKMEKI